MAARPEPWTQLYKIMELEDQLDAAKAEITNLKQKIRKMKRLKKTRKESK